MGNRVARFFLIFLIVASVFSLVAMKLLRTLDFDKISSVVTFGNVKTISTDFVGEPVAATVLFAKSVEEEEAASYERNVRLGLIPEAIASRNLKYTIEFDEDVAGRSKYGYHLNDEISEKVTQALDEYEKSKDKPFEMHEIVNSVQVALLNPADYNYARTVVRDTVISNIANGMNSDPDVYQREIYVDRNNQSHVLDSVITDALFLSEIEASKSK